MRDLFYTILIVWILWRILNSISSFNARQKNSSNNSSSYSKPIEGETKIDYVPPVKKKIDDDEGEYVDYEEIK
jgi:hypothetical protein